MQVGQCRQCQLVRNEAGGRMLRCWSCHLPWIWDSHKSRPLVAIWKFNSLGFKVGETNSTSFTIRKDMWL